MTPYRIVLADDHIMLREGIKRMIEETRGLAVVGEAGDGLELLRLLIHQVPDMVILDISMPRLRGLEAASEIRKRHPGVAILFLSMYKKQEYLYLALQAGAKGYLLKEDTGTELIHAIQAIRSGRTYLSSLILKEMPHDLIGLIQGNHRYDGDPLTSRERQVLQLVAEGKTSREIAAALCVSVHTVNNHRKNIRHKLNISTNAELIQFAMRKGYAPEPV
jgi:DNA-binding NarL/FixJ family response regulator